MAEQRVYIVYAYNAQRKIEAIGDVYESQAAAAERAERLGIAGTPDQTGVTWSWMERNCYGQEANQEDSS